MIPHALTEWSRWQEALREKELFLFLDYDGTLTPIVERPELAKLNPDTRLLLQDLSALKHVNVSIISGRPLSELKRLIGIRRLFYVGNHGFEAEGPKVRRRHFLDSKTQKLLSRIHRQLKNALKPMPDILVENKRFTLSIHYRSVRADQIERAFKILMEVIHPFLASQEIAISEGKKVWEIRPKTDWNKGKAVLWLLERFAGRRNHRGQNGLAIYMGDDTTDEDAFRVLEGKGLTVKVTDMPEAKTFAHYYVDSCEEVLTFLTQIKEYKSEDHG